jgi:hypothetical protein
VLTKPKFGWNLFSRLFEKRWDAFHVRDKNGRIYVDLKEEWMRPLIDSKKYNETGEGPISPISIHDIVSSSGMKVLLSMISDCKLQNSCWEDLSFLQPQEVQFHLLYSTDFTGRKSLLHKTMDMRFKTLVYVVSCAGNIQVYKYILFLHVGVGVNSMDVYDFTTGEPWDFISSERNNISDNLLLRSINFSYSIP